MLLCFFLRAEESKKKGSGGTPQQGIALQEKTLSTLLSLLQRKKQN